MYNIQQNVCNLSFLSKYNGFLQHIHFEDEHIQKQIYRNIIRDRLVFKKEWNTKWKFKHTVQLMKYLGFDKNDKLIILNDHLLYQLHLKFEKLFSCDEIRTQCYSLGIDYVPPEFV